MWRICGVSKVEPVLFARNPDDDYVSTLPKSVTETRQAISLIVSLSLSQQMNMISRVYIQPTYNKRLIYVMRSFIMINGIK